MRDGTPYVRTGGTEAITVYEFLEEEDGTMIYADPVYMYRFPNMVSSCQRRKEAGLTLFDTCLSPCISRLMI